MTEMVQVQLSSQESRLTCYVPTKPYFKVGDTITLKNSEDPGRYWLVDWKSIETIDSSKIHRNWNNNI